MLPLRPPHSRAYCFGDLSRNEWELGLGFADFILRYHSHLLQFGVGLGFIGTRVQRCSKMTWKEHGT